MIAQGRPNARVLIWLVFQVVLPPLVTGAFYAGLVMSDGSDDWSRGLFVVLFMLPASLAFGLAMPTAWRPISPRLALSALFLVDGVALIMLGVAFGTAFSLGWLGAATWLVSSSVAIYYGSVALTTRELDRAARPFARRFGLIGQARWFDAEAEVVFLPATGDGLRVPVHSGHLCTIAYDNRLRSADLWFGDGGTAAPGETVTARLRFSNPRRPEDAIEPGMVFEVREGPRVVAHGRIIRPLGDDDGTV